MAELLFKEHTTCQSCGATVQLRVNKNRKVYYHCDGQADELSCLAAFKYGAAQSRRIIAEATERNRTKPDDGPKTDSKKDDAPQDDNEEKAGSKTDAGAGEGNEPGADPGDDAGAKRESGLIFS